MPKDEKKQAFQTRAIHAGYDPKAHQGSRVPPLYQTTAYLFDSSDYAARLFRLEEAGYIYTRLNNPTVDAFEQRMANLEGGVAAVGFASGMAAISSTLLAFIETGDEIVAASSLYGGTYNLLSVTLPRLGIKTHFVDAADAASFEKALNEKTKAIYCETIGNPKIDTPDFEAISKIAGNANIPLLVDNTVATPYLCRPIEHGADVVIHSASKYIGGQGAALGGVTIFADSFDWLARFERMKPYQAHGAFAPAICLRNESLRDFGGALAPMNAFLFLQGLETLALRMERHSKNAARVAAWLSEQAAVERVNYPTLPLHPTKSNAEKYLPKGYSSLLSFELKGGYEAGKRLVDKVEMIHHLANLGDTKTLILHPASTSHEQLTSEEKLAAGAGEKMIRMSIGLEEADDIIADIARGL